MNKTEDSNKQQATSDKENHPVACHLSPVATMGFTLVELLVVIAILGILISLVTAGAQAARRRAAVTKAKTVIASLETAIAMYSGDMGEYPATGNSEMISALQDDPEHVDWQGPYMEFKEDELDGGELLDSWGKPYFYVSVSGVVVYVMLYH